MTQPVLPVPPSWSLVGHAARWGGAAIDLADPGRGLRLATPVDDAILALDAASGERSLVPSDVWARGGDLTAVYEPADERRLRATMTWRPSAAAPDEGWEAIVSAQTALVTSDPHVAIVADVATGRPLWGSLDANSVRWSESAPPAPACLLLRRPGAAVLVVVHPEAEHRLSLEHRGTRSRVVCRLFSEPVEKGVLLRARVLTARLADDAAEADRIVRAFVASPPVLTT